jgi:methylenetetrahydrofolate dehydrogenase (NADP+)/methenyltetrahydrofolate cyclohydrolase
VSSTERLLGEPVAASIRESVRGRVRELDERGVEPTLGTVLASDDPGDRRFMDLKHAACEDVGIATRAVNVDPDAPAKRVYRAVDELSADPEVSAVFVQTPLPDHVELTAVRRRLDPRKDVDCFHFENVGRLVAGHPRFVPATPAAVRRLLSADDVPLEGRDVVVVGRSHVIGKPLANLLLQDSADGNATVTVCHSRTPDLGEHTRRADVLVTACGVPELVDGSMLSPGVVVVDVSANRRGTNGNGDAEVVGDVEFASAKEVASAITPVPGGAGPVTLACLLENMVLAAERRLDGGIDD